MEGRTVYLLTALLILITFTGSSHSASCCLRYFEPRRELPCQRVLGYTYQSMGKSCDINAVILHLPRRFLCAEPTASWTQRAMQCVDERRRKNAESLQRFANITAAA
ncbi:C-C motif chemokine 20b [Vanacampus margaritifer]